MNILMYLVSTPHIDYVESNINQFIVMNTLKKLISNKHELNPRKVHKYNYQLSNTLGVIIIIIG
jgi:hypothetical protein